MNGRSKSVRLCVVFALSGVLTMMCLVSTGFTLSSSVSHYLDVVMAVLMVILLFCVLELCLGVELCAFCCAEGSRQQDAEGRDENSSPATPEPSEAPPAYEVIMAHDEAETPTGGATGGEQERESVSLKCDFLYLKPPTGENMQPSISPSLRETAFVSVGELWLAVDGLPSYEEAVARLREEVVVARVWQEEAATRLREETESGLQEDMTMGQGQKEEEEEEETTGREAAVARMREEGTE